MKLESLRAMLKKLSTKGIENIYADEYGNDFSVIEDNSGDCYIEAEHPMM